MNKQQIIKLNKTLKLLSNIGAGMLFVGLFLLACGIVFVEKKPLSTYFIVIGAAISLVSIYFNAIHPKWRTKQIESKICANGTKTEAEVTGFEVEHKGFFDIEYRVIMKTCDSEACEIFHFEIYGKDQTPKIGTLHKVCYDQSGYCVYLKD